MPSDRNIGLDLGAIARTVRQSSQESDGKLVVVGSRLTNAVDILGVLTQRFESLPRELETEALRDTAGRLVKVSEQIPAIAAALFDEKATLSRLAALSQHVGARIAQLKKTVGVISILAMNAQIETAHIAAAGEDFAAFAKEIVRLAKKAEKTIDGYAQEHQKLSRVLQSACQAQDSFLRTQEDMLRIAGGKLAESLQTIEARRRQAAAVAGEIGHRAKSIGDEVGAVVMALQIGDITRQRLEHVADTFETLAGAYQPGRDLERDSPPWSAGLTEGQRNGVLAVILRMECAQLEHAAKEFETKICSVAGSLERLGSDASAIIHLGGETYGTAGCGGRSFLEELESSLERAGTLMSQCEAARRNVDDVVVTVTTSLDDLLGRIASVQDIEAEMRLVGLNTALKCGRLGLQGRTLGVISQELRAYANQTVEDADGLTATLHDIGQVANQLKQDRQEWGAEQLAAMQRDLVESCAPFQECGSRLGNALEALSAKGGEVSRMLADTAAGITWHGAIARTLESACERLRAIGAALPCDELDEQHLAERLAHFSDGRYTMASERGIHARFAGGTTENALAGASSAKPSASLEDILF